MICLMPFSLAYTAAVLRKNRFLPGTKVFGKLPSGLLSSIFMDVSVREFEPKEPMKDMSI